MIEHLVQHWYDDLQVIVLAGGIGSRVRTLLEPDQPKIMVETPTGPFIKWLFDYLASQNISELILALGYGHNRVISWLNQNVSLYEYTVNHVIEEEPLGTGGALKNALHFCEVDCPLVVINGDTVLDVDLHSLFAEFAESECYAAVVGQETADVDRFGRITVDSDMLVSEFSEKCSGTGAGIKNAGIYFFRVAGPLLDMLPDICSIERMLLPKLADDNQLYCVIADGETFDFGTPQALENLDIVLREK